jgi:hypothetical protein
MCDEPDVKRAKLSDESAAAAAETCCSTLDEAMRLAHPGCLRTHLTQETPDSTFGGYIVWLHAECRRSNVSCTDCVKALPQLWLKDVKKWHRVLAALVDSGCVGCLTFLFSTIETDSQWDFMRCAAAGVSAEGSMIPELYRIAADSKINREYRLAHGTSTEPVLLH